ncbi:enolase C-terminal domain-like protein [uncultured Acidaminococcus sp.]|uniref:enolase C-terminal domain-like protein n=1 Tax=uncultured Acidaminococcus sp. TaxID=352152 RepID=UPI0026764112|nr:enolase C-terminal domain-like protein [uncultured Acidaminococcus sp.]
MKMKSPVVTKMEVIPVAGYDSMLMSLSGAHAPWFTRNLVILTDNLGHQGIGEIHGGDYTCKSLRACIPFVEGKEISYYRKILQTIHRNAKKDAGDDGEGIQNLDLSKLKYVVRAEWAIECALLDLLGQFMEVPMCELLGEGKQRNRVEMLGYLFYVSDKQKAAELPYIDESDSDDEWFQLRRQEMLTPEKIVHQAQVLQRKYGFRNFKLKGGVLRGESEMTAVRALKETFPSARINIDPNGAWRLEEAVKLCQSMQGILTYIEDPCGPQDGFSGREIMTEFKNAVPLQVATNMIATDWRQFYHAIMHHSVDIVLADPHFWGFEGTIRMAQILHDWGLTWGSHSNNHFDITLAAFAQVGAAAPGDPAPLDTHWVWQDGQDLLLDAPKIKDGFITVPEGPGLGVHLNRKRVEKAHALYNRLPYHDRNDVIGMQYLIPGWKFNSKMPALIR